MGPFRFFRSSHAIKKKAEAPQKNVDDDVVEENPLVDHPRYERLGAVNKGAFGFVSRYYDKETQQPVAIKFLPRGSKIQVHVEREILNHKALRHPHVVRLMEVFVTEKYLAIVMEYADQGDLFRYVKSNGRLREDVARWIFQQLIFGLDYCHKKGIANRDIKLENILLSGNPKRPSVKLCDFGYSKHAEWDSAPTSRVGTPDYMSPDILRSRGGQYDAKAADLWSCGVVLYVMVVGKYPFSHKEDSQYEVEKQHRLVLERILGLNYSIPPFLSASCKELLKRLLDPNPETRITIAGIIDDPWHKVGLPPSAAHMNDVYISAESQGDELSDEAIIKIVKTAMKTPQADLISEEYIRSVIDSDLIVSDQEVE